MFLCNNLLLVVRARGQLFRHPPSFWNGRIDWCDRYLGCPTGDKGRKDYGERLSVAVASTTSEQEPEIATDVLYAGRDAGIGRLEVEVVGVFETLRLYAEISG
jgi:hypothetical protein